MIDAQFLEPNAWTARVLRDDLTVRETPATLVASDEDGRGRVSLRFVFETQATDAQVVGARFTAR